MAENRQTLVVKDKQEQDAEVARLLADGWKVATYHPKSIFFPTPGEFSDLRGITLEKDGKEKTIKTKNTLAENAVDAGFKIRIFQLKIGVVLLLLVILALVLIHTGKI